MLSMGNIQHFVVRLHESYWFYQSVVIHETASVILDLYYYMPLHLTEGALKI